MTTPRPKRSPTARPPAPAPGRSSAPTSGRKSQKSQGKSPKKRPRARAGQTPPSPQPEALFQRLTELYPDAHCALHHQNAWELLVATILSAQCTDARVNLVTPALFARYPGPRELAQASPADVEALIRSTGFYRNKARHLLGAARRIVDRHAGEVPRSLEELVELPGVARKTANVVLGNALGVEAGVVVDTHIGRLSRRLGLSAHNDPVKVERDLMALFPRERWTLLAHLLISHGRSVCTARNPRCDSCPLRDLCPRVGVKA